MYKSATAVPKAICPVCPALSGSFMGLPDSVNGQLMWHCGSLSGLSGGFSIALRMRARAKSFLLSYGRFSLMALGLTFYQDKQDKEKKGFVFARFFVSGWLVFQPDTAGQAGQAVH